MTKAPNGPTSTTAGLVELTPCGRGLESYACGGCDCGLETLQVRHYRAEITRLQAELVAARAQIAAMQDVVDAVRKLIADDHMFPTTDDAAWGVVTHHWDRVVAALAALSSAEDVQATGAVGP